MCAGYPPQRGSWPKPEAKPAQVNIESKDPNYVPPGAYGMPQQQPYPNPPIPGHVSKRDPIAYNRTQPSLRITPPQGRPLQSDDDRPTASTLPSASVGTPDNKLSALSGYTTSATANMFPTPVSAAPTIGRRHATKRRPGARDTKSGTSVTGNASFMRKMRLPADPAETRPLSAGASDRPPQFLRCSVSRAASSVVQALEETCGVNGILPVW